MATYASADEAASFIRIDDSDEHPELQTTLDTASRVIDTYCGWTFDDADAAATARVFAVDPRIGRDLLYVDPISSTTDLVVKTDESHNGVFDRTWSTSDYQLEPLNQRQGGLTDHPYYKIRAIDTYLFPVWKRQALVEVTARWGWSSGVPDAVRTATILVAKYLHEERMTLSGFAFDNAGTSAFTAGAMSPRVKMLLAPYRRVYV